jgi:hypothetical protein
LDSSNESAWDDFCLKSTEAWFWHTTKWLDYTLEYRPELRPVSQSFFVRVGRQIAAICPLVLETYCEPDGEVRQFSYGGDAVPAPAFAEGLSADARKAARKAIFQQIDELAASHGVHRVSIRGAPLAPHFWRSDRPLANPLLLEGYSDISSLTQVIDLAVPYDRLWRELRNDHRRNIKRAEKILSILIFDASNITSDQFERYRLLHRKAAGRTTRPRSTFDMMYRWIREGLALLSCATLDGRDVGFTLTCTYKDGAYYGSGCNDPEFNDLPIGHLLHWRTMNWLRDHHIRYYETGLQQYASQPHSIISRKDWNIAYFKRGFGGFTVPYWRVEKFYDEDFCRRVLEERAALYARTVSNSGFLGVS